MIATDKTNKRPQPRAFFVSARDEGRGGGNTAPLPRADPARKLDNASMTR
ncbi:hypothetical protein [Ostreiculturibacter nitratireducens]